MYAELCAICGDKVLLPSVARMYALLRGATDGVWDLRHNDTPALRHMFTLVPR